MKTVAQLFILWVLVFSFHPSFGQFDSVNKIGIYGRIWGMIKYYHPAVQKNNINWDSVFIQEYSKFKNAVDPFAYNELISHLLDTVGQIKTTTHPNKYFPEDTTVCNLDFEWIDSSSLLSLQNKESLKNIIRFYKPRNNKAFKKENINYDMKEVWQSKYSGSFLYPDEPHSMLVLFNYWNRINYFFAYKDLMDFPWDKTLNEFIPRVEQTAGRRDFYLLIAELITRINDGHGSCANREVYNEIGYSFLEFTIDYVEGKTVVSSINDSVSEFLGIKRGDEILETNGKPISQRRKELDKYIGGSNRNCIELVKNYSILGLKYWGPFTIKIKDTLGIEKVIAFYRDSTFNHQLLYHFIRQRTIAKPYKFVSDKYGYIDAGMTTVKDVHRAFRSFASAKGIIIDLRKYGGAPTFFYLAHLTNKNIPYAVLYMGNDKFPGTFEKVVYKTNWLGMAFLYKKYKGKIIVLADEHTGSGMELMAMEFRATGNVTIVGRNTGGFDGGCRTFTIHPDYGAAYSGTAVFYPDGRQTQRIGIVPDIYVNSTYEGVKSGKDEILERAILFLNTSK